MLFNIRWTFFYIWFNKSRIERNDQTRNYFSLRYSCLPFMEQSDEIIIAVTGCVHGKIDKVYALLDEVYTLSGVRPELVICTGDFEAHRDVYDLESMKAPEKYVHMGSFYKYDRNEAAAPYLTLVVGGNHESSTYNWELFYGGWLCPNIYYMGICGSVYYRGLRILGVSGIYQQHTNSSCLLSNLYSHSIFLYFL